MLKSMISREKNRFARAALRWSGADLASRAGVGVQTVKRFELGTGIPHSRSATSIG
jgi:transcriptional regulator with XRE-family HTH domain